MLAGSQARMVQGQSDRLVLAESALQTCQGTHKALTAEQLWGSAGEATTPCQVGRPGTERPEARALCSDDQTSQAGTQPLRSVCSPRAVK